MNMRKLTHAVAALAVTATPVIGVLAAIQPSGTLADNGVISTNSTGHVFAEGGVISTSGTVRILADNAS